VTLAAALFSLALLARAAPFEAKPGTVRFVRIANSAFDRCTKSPTPSEQAWMRAVGVDRAERLCPRRGGGVGDARADHRYGMADRACPVAAQTRYDRIRDMRRMIAEAGLRVRQWRGFGLPPLRPLLALERSRRLRCDYLAQRIVWICERA